MLCDRNSLILGLLGDSFIMIPFHTRDTATFLSWDVNAGACALDPPTPAVASDHSENG